MHSQECLSFLPRYLRRIPGVSPFLRRRQSAPPGGRPSLDFSRAWWTPPLSPAGALQVERAQIGALGLHPLVSLTDHDDIEAGATLGVTAARDEVPVSVEWTAPYGQSILHLGIHNLPAGGERRALAAMRAYTAAPGDARLPDLLAALSRIPETLIVLNHPFWREEGIGEAAHLCALEAFLRDCREWIHAIELNGTRPWSENAAAIALAETHGLPTISGGDRHACEPAACLNLTNARSFSEFAAEIREGSSVLLFLPQYREPLGLRFLEAIWDILRPYPEYPGRERWIDRIFYRGEDEVARPLSTVWRDQAPWMLNGAAAAVQLLATTKLRLALRLLLAERGEVFP
jgi:predicted metal-dependent phosphoesterase TrpH